MNSDGKCKSCYVDQGYYLNNDSICFSCTDSTGGSIGVANCKVCNSSGACTECLADYKPVLTQCKKCEFRCLECVLNSDGDDLRCTKCKSGYKLIGEGTDLATCEKCNI